MHSRFPVLARRLPRACIGCGLRVSGRAMAGEFGRSLVWSEDVAALASGARFVRRRGGIASRRRPRGGR